MCATSSQTKLIRKLREALGDMICATFEEDEVVEMMFNSDKKVFIESRPAEVSQQPRQKIIGEAVDLIT